MVPQLPAVKTSTIRFTKLDSIENSETSGPNKLCDRLTTFLVKLKAFKWSRYLEVFKA